MKINLLRNNFKDLKFLIWDAETESLNLRYNHPWQVSFIVTQGNQVEEEHDFFIKWPDLNVSKGAAKVTGFDQTKIDREGKDPLEVLEFLNKYLYNDKYMIAGHNVLNFDSMIHNAWMLDCGKKTDFSWMSRLYDTHLMSKALKENITPPDADLLSWQFKLNNFRKKGLKTSLGVMAKEFEIEFDEKNLHSAISDVILTFEVLKKLIWKLDI